MSEPIQTRRLFELLDEIIDAPQDEVWSYIRDLPEYSEECTDWVDQGDNTAFVLKDGTVIRWQDFTGEWNALSPNIQDEEHCYGAYISYFPFTGHPEVCVEVLTQGGEGVASGYLTWTGEGKDIYSLFTYATTVLDDNGWEIDERRVEHQEMYFKVPCRRKLTS